MSIFISVEDPEGEPLTEVFEIEKIFRKFSKDSGQCLRFITEQVDASFNMLQTPGLVAELEAIGTTTLAADEQKELDRLLKVCAKHAGKQNEYIRFYGETKSAE
ncbi:MAG TPA: hypothetical protein VMX33_03025 [bacterium]|nr:hypothetical protein [bacterium]